MIELRRPLGLVLAGGGAMGAWQLGALAELESAGLAFDAVLGFSAGALNGAAYCLGLLEEAKRRWSQAPWPWLPAPRLTPFSLCSQKPLLRAIDYGLDEAAARGRARCRLVVASAHVDRCRAIYAEFDPKGRWDERLDLHLLASCAIPSLFPPVEVDFRGRRAFFIDGGVPTRKPFSFLPLGSCADVLVLEMVRPEETSQEISRWPWLSIEQRSRRSSRGLIDDGVSSLRGAEPSLRIRRLGPSRRLGHMLDFGKSRVAEDLRLGAGDARAFLAG